MTRIRFRADSAFAADDVARWERGEETKWFDVGEFTLLTTEPAEPGDTWRVRWAGSDAVAGYAICCPKCREVHHWTSAHGCGGGKESCPHSGVSSCWTWSGSPEDGTLSAQPSLHCVASLGGCGWHGYLTDGELRECPT